MLPGQNKRIEIIRYQTQYLIFYLQKLHVKRKVNETYQTNKMYHALNPDCIYVYSTCNRRE